MEEIHKVPSVPYSPPSPEKDTEKRLMCLKSCLIAAQKESVSFLQ